MLAKSHPLKPYSAPAPEYLKKQGTPETLDDLKHHQMLHYNLSNSSTWKLTDKQGKQHFINVDAKISANNGDFLKDMAIAGHGIIMIPTFIAWKAVAMGELVAILPGYNAPQLNAYAVYPQTRYLSQRTRVLIDFLVERFGENPYWDQHI